MASRHSLVLSAILSVLIACAASAQTPTTPARIGMLCPVRCAGIGYVAFDDELRKLGWFEGRNLTIERRAAEGRYERLPDLVAELIRTGPALIVAASVEPARAAKEATSEIPIVFSFVADPVGIGLVQSLARPGGNATGVTALIPGAFLAKHLEIVRELLPNAQRVAILSNPDNEDARRALLREAPTASQFGLQMDVIHVRGRDEIPAAVASAKHISADALLIMGDSMLNTPPNTIPDLVGELALPAIYQNRQAVEAGGLIAYVPDLSAIARRHAHFVDRVLRGASPADLPVEQPTKYDLIINLKTAKTLKLTIPSSLLARADEVLD